MKNESLVKELSQHGQLVSPIRRVSLGCKSTKLKHVVCHRRRVVILKDTESPLNLPLKTSIIIWCLHPLTI